MEEYMRLLLEQIRCKKAHPYIKAEIQGHIEEQMEDNMRLGMSKEEAEKAAIEDMGSPVETGISLDGIHKPQIAWGIIGLVAVISVLGSILQLIMSKQTGYFVGEGAEFLLHTMLGFLLMLMIYRVDYTNIARFSRIIAVLLLGIYIFSFIGGIEVNGRIWYVWRNSPVRISISAIMILYVPLYGAIIYKDYGQGYKGILKSIMWMLAPVIIAFRLPHLPLAVLLLLSMAVVLTVAISQGWFQVSKKKTIGCLWGCILGMPVLGLNLLWKCGLLASYQVERIKAFFQVGEMTRYVGYVSSMLQENIQESKMFGSNGKDLGKYVFTNGDYFLSYIFSAYGLILGVIICCILAVLILEIFAVSFGQKNQLGRCMGCGCGIVILINFLYNIGLNIGRFPLMQSFLPLFSAGGNNIMVCYILLGIVLSIYRYKNIYPSKIDTRLKTMKIEI